MHLRDIPLFLRLASACIAIIRNPKNIDDVLALSHHLHHRFDKGLSLSFFSNHPQTNLAVIEKPLPLPINFSELETLPAHSLGAALLAFLKAEKVDPKNLVVYKRLNPRNSDEYILEHLLQTHDIWHVVTGFGTDVKSELGLQGFYAAQNPSLFPPLIIALGLLNGVLFDRQDVKSRLHAIGTGYAMGQRAKMLFGQDWQKMWSQPLSKVRNELSINAWQENDPIEPSNLLLQKT